MNKYIFIVLGLCFSFGLTAQDAVTTDFEVNGIKVIHKPSTKQVISAKLFFRGGTANYTKGQEGIEALALSWVAQAGSADYPKDKFNATLEKMSTSISGSANYDYASLSMGCLTKYWDQSWDVFADVICNSTYSETEFDNIKGQMIAGAQQGESDPDTHLRNSAMGNTFIDKPYSRIPEGSAKSLESITAEQAKNHFEGLRNTAQMFVVVVGDVNPADLKEKIAELTCVPLLAIRPGKFPVTEITESSYNGMDREIATNYVRGMLEAPFIGEVDEMAMRVAMAILHDHLWTEIRTKRNLSYAPGAYFPSAILRDPYCILYVSTDKPNEAVQVMVDEIRGIRKNGFTEEELINKKGEFLTQYYMGQETNSSLAETIGKSVLTTGWKAGELKMKKVNELTVRDLDRAFKKYSNAINWTYLGDTSIVDETVFTQEIEPGTSTKKGVKGPPGGPTNKALKKAKRKNVKQVPRQKKGNN